MNLFRRLSSFGRESGNARRVAERRKVVPQVEVLESRDAPAVVTASGDAGPGTLRDTINTAPAGDTITFAASVGPSITLTSGRIAINKNLTISGPGASALSINGNANSNIFSDTTVGTTLSISGLTLTNANARGGAVFINGSNISLTLANCVVTGNQANGGGAAYIRGAGSSINIMGCSLTNNTATGGSDGGALYARSGASVMIQNSSITGNNSGNDGGGVYVRSGSGNLTISNSNISGNIAKGNGGGIEDFTSGTTIINNTTIANNTDSSTGNGGGLAFANGTGTITNCTISGNTHTTGNGGGIFLYSGTLNLQNTIVSGNTDVSGQRDIYRYGGTLNASNDLIQSLPAGTINGTNTANITGVAANLGTLKNNGGLVLPDGSTLQTMALLPGSPAIDKGDNTLVPSGFTNDERGAGFNRIINGGTSLTVDIGAYEFQPPATTTTLTSSANPSTLNQSVTFTATVAATAAGSNTPQGTVTFSVDGTAQAPVTLVNGVATFSTATLTAGSHTILAVYNGFTQGDYTLSTSQQSLTQTVNGNTPPPPSTTRYFAVGADAGGGPQVVVYNAATGAVVSSFFAFAPSFGGGVRVAVDDVNGDGTPDIIAAAGPGGGPQVEVIDGTRLTQVQSNGQIANAALLASFYAFPSSFTGGVYVAAGISSSGQNWIAAGAGAGGGPQVVVWTARAVLTGGTTTAPTSLVSYFAYAPTFSGGVNVALGDLNGDGKLDVITGAGPGGGPQVTVLDGTKFASIQGNGTFPSSALLANFYAFNPSFTGGVFVSGGVTSGTQFNLIVGQGPTAAPQAVLVVINGAQVSQLASNGQIASGAVLGNLPAFSNGFTGAVHVGFSAAYGSGGKPTILAGPGPLSGPEVAPFDGATFQALSNFFALPSTFTGGLFIAG